MGKTRRRLLLAAMLGLMPFATHASTLYEDLGGADGIHVIVDHFVDHLLADPRAAPTFADSNIERFRRLMNEQLCELSGGPCHYSGRSMASAHRGLNLDQAEFNAAAEDLQQALNEAGVGFHTQNRLIALLAPMQRDVVSK